MRRRQFGLVAVGAPPRVGELASPTIFMEGVAVVGHGRRREARRRLLHSSRAAEAQGRHEVVGRIGRGVGGGLGTGVVRIKDEVVSSRKGCGDEAPPGAAHGCLCARCMMGAADGRTRDDAQRRGTQAARIATVPCVSRGSPSGGVDGARLTSLRGVPLFIGRVVLGRLEMRSLLRGGANTHSTFY